MQSKFFYEITFARTNRLDGPNCYMWHRNRTLIPDRFLCAMPVVTFLTTTGGCNITDDKLTGCIVQLGILQKTDSV